MDFTTDLQIKKWKPSKNQELKRVGKGLYVRGFTSGRKLFQLRFKQQWIDIGDYGDKSLATATELALASVRKLKANLISVGELKASLARSSSTDDLSAEIERKTDDTANSKTGIPTFSELYRAWYKENLQANRWTHKSSISKPIQAFEKHAEEAIGNLRIDKITRSVLRETLQPVYLKHHELGPDLRRFIDEVLELAYDKEIISHNPCPKNTSFTRLNRKTRHAASLDHNRLPKLWSWIGDAPFGLPVKTAMKTVIITAHRAAVVAYARWEHVDLDTGVWTVPEKPDGRMHLGYMKSGREFSFQLPKGLVADFAALAENNERHPDYIFSADGNKPINPETLRANFRKFGDVTSHGFRNSFKVWCLHNDVDHFAADRYVDHSLQGLDRAYRRSDMFEERANLAERYFQFVAGAT